MWHNPGLEGQVEARLTRNSSVVSLNPIKGACRFIEQKNYTIIA